MDREVWILVETLLLGGSCAHSFVSERLCNSQNKNEMNYKNSDCVKFLVFVNIRGLCSFPIMSTCWDLNNSEEKRSETKTCMK